MIKVKGNQVAPAELEALLLEHPAVADAGVVGVTMYVYRQPKQAKYLRFAEKEKSSHEPTSFDVQSRRLMLRTFKSS